MNFQIDKSNQTKSISKITTFIVVLLCILAIFVSLILNITMREGLFIQGINFIYEYQQGSPSVFVRSVHNIFSLLGNTIVVIAYLVLLYLIIYRKLSVLVFLTYSMINIYFMIVMKQCFQQPRPYWYSDSIKQLQWNCQRQYGHPSGHSWVSVLFYQPLISDFIGAGPFQIGFLFPILSGIFVPLSRMYLGSHSSNQIIMGLLYSMIFLVLYRYIFQQKLFHLYFRLMSKNSKAIIITLLLIFNVILFLIPIIIYIVNKNNRYLNQEYLNNMNSACKIQQTYEQIQKSVISSAAIIQLIFGFLYGIIFMPKSTYLSYFLGEWKYQSFKNVVLKLLIYICCLGLPALIFLLIIPIFLKDAVGSYIVQSVGYLLMGIGLVCFTPRLAIYWNIIKIDKNDEEARSVIKSIKEERL